ncbi:MAG TPA: hypothetical protein VIJ86_10295 [Acidimicrobiales bacterium]
MLLVVVFYWSRTYKMGISKRIWPVVTICLGALILGVASRNWFSLIPSDVTIRGMQALFLIGLGLMVLALIDRRWSFALFVAGFLGLALLSCLYDVVNLFQRFGIGASWSAKDQALPNHILPGMYLVLGSVTFWTFRNRQFRTSQPDARR